MHWEHAWLTAQADLLGFSLCLRPTVYRKPHGMQWWHWSPPGREVGSGAVGHVALQSPLLHGGRIRSCRTCGTLKPSLTGRRGPESWYVWWHRGTSYQVGEIWSHWTHGSRRAHLDWKADSGVIGHVATRGCTLRSLS
jgi:hypothetical protein